jgi:hypothetical protein
MAGEPIKLSSKSYAIGIFIFTVKDSHAFIDGIYREGLISLINGMGYFKRYQNDNSYQYIIDNKNIISHVEIAQIRDDVKEYVQRLGKIDFDNKGISFYATAEKQKETFLRNSPSLFNDAILGHLPNHTKPILRDNQTAMFFSFKNCLIRIDADGINQVDYSDVTTFAIWDKHIIKHSVEFSDQYESSQFAQFISNISNGEPDRINAFRSAIGYLTHNYSNATTARAVIAYDQEVTTKSKPVGGTGKGIFIHATKQLRNTAIIDGKKIKDENQFAYQLVTPLTQIIAFDDVRPDFNFLMLNSNLTTGWQIEHKRIPAFRFEPSENPKTYITSNTILKSEGTTATRRQFVLEFSDFYSKLVQQNIEPIIHIHGGMFFSSDWDQSEWNRFFTYMFSCGQYYLINGLQFYSLRSVNQNKLIQYTSDDFAEWINESKISTQQSFNLKDAFIEFKDQYYGNDSDFKQRIFTNYLKLYALTMNLKLDLKRSNNQTIAKFI